MSTIRKIFIFSLVTFSGLLLIGALFLLFFVDINSYKTKLEATASNALGLDVKVDGRIGLGFFPSICSVCAIAYRLN